MASSSGSYKDGIFINNNIINKQPQSQRPQQSQQQQQQQQQGVHGGEWGMPTFQHQKIISMDWSSEEQALLEEGLSNYSSEANIIRYAKIAVQLKNKTVRDVALRCRWMTKKDINKRRKDDFNARKIKDRKEKVIDSLAKPSFLAIQSGLPHAQGMVSNCSNDGISYNDFGGATRQLLHQNDWVFKQISTNLATHQMRENICLLSQARDNIFKILSNLNDMGPTMKKMPPLPKVDEELAKSILPPAGFQIQ